MSIVSSIPGVRKNVLGCGKGLAPQFEKNSKAIFHFRTLRLEPDGGLSENDGTIIDDTRTLGTGPFELLIGREFKLGILETMVKEMLIGEVARFSCPYELVSEYPAVSKALREISRKKHGHHDDDDHHSHTHQCGFSALVHGSGHNDLDGLMKDMPPIAFEIELLHVEKPGSYKQDSWAMTDEEKVELVPKLKEDGNELYRNKNYKQASDKYFEALGYLESLSIKEKPQSSEWNRVEEIKVPLLLNYSQCQLLLQEYPEVIRQTTKILEFDPNCVKALYRRGKAHSATWNLKDAVLDLQRAVELDNSLKRNVDKELLELTRRLKEKDEEEKKRLKGKLFT